MMLGLKSSIAGHFGKYFALTKWRIFFFFWGGGARGVFKLNNLNIGLVQFAYAGPRASRLPGEEKINSNFKINR